MRSRLGGAHLCDPTAALCVCVVRVCVRYPGHSARHSTYYNCLCAAARAWRGAKEEERNDG